jgi:hypothetical protein
MASTGARVTLIHLLIACDRPKCQSPMGHGHGPCGDRIPIFPFLWVSFYSHTTCHPLSSLRTPDSAVRSSKAKVALYLR